MILGFLNGKTLKNWYKTIVNKYKNLRIFKKLILTYTILLGVVCAVSLISLRVTLEIFDNQLYLKSVQVLNFFITSIENEFRNIEKFSLNTALDDNTQNQITKIINKSSDYEKHVETNYIKDSLLLHSLSERNLTSISYVDTNGLDFTVGRTPPNIDEKRKNLLLYRALMARGGYVYVEPDLDYQNMIFAREILRYGDLSLTPLGVLIFTTNIKEVVNNNFSLLQNDKTKIFIYSGGKMIFSSDNGQEFRDININNKEKQGYSISTINNRKYFISYVTSEYMNWSYVSILPYDEFYKKNIMVRYILLSILIVLFILTIYISYKIARNITRPIEDLTASMKLAEKGEFRSVDLNLSDYERTDEVGFLQKDFLIMIDKINLLIKENYEKQLLLKDTEYKALQAQINPHFLYNTFSSINWLIKSGRYNDSSMMIMSISNLLRSSVNKKHLVTIGEEEKFLESYINIQQIRYEDRVEFFINIDERHKNYLIPRMILQPIVENSINYGVENMLRICTISISSNDAGENIEILVEDNGPGMEQEFLDNLRAFQIKPRGTGIGLKNINDRLKLVFGEEYGLKIESRLNAGTKITAVLPKKEVNNV